MFWFVYCIALLMPFALHHFWYKHRKKRLSTKLKFEEVVMLLDVSVHTPITVCYSLYVVGFLISSFFEYTIEGMFATQLTLTLLILNFLSFLLAPFPMSLNVIAKVRLDRHHVRIKQIVPSLRFGDMQKWVAGHLERYFYHLRMDVYRAFMEHENDKDIRAYLKWKRYKQTDIDDHMYEVLYKYDPVGKAKTLFVLVVFLFFTVNYVSIYTGVRADVLHFSKDLFHWEAPLYYLISTFSTVGYGDVTPIDAITRSLTLFLLFNTVLILLIVVNVIQDYTSQSMERIMAPFKSFQIFLRDETNELIYWVETNQVEERVLPNTELFHEYPDLYFSVQAYCDRKKVQAKP